MSALSYFRAILCLFSKICLMIATGPVVPERATGNPGTGEKKTMNDNADLSTPVRTIIADDHPLVLLAIENLMAGYPNMQIVGRAADATELFKEVDRIPCDLVLMDLYMPGGFYGDGLETIRRFK